MKILGKAIELAERGTPAALVTVIATQGSTPRHPGARMLVTSTGETVGTIGGGRVEHEVTQAGRAIAAGAPATRVVHHLVRDLAMCCGGTMEFLIQPAAPSTPAFAEALAALARRDSMLLEMPLDGSPARIGPLEGSAARPAVSGERFLEPIRPTPRLILFGAGHVARAVGPLAHRVGFEIVLCDDGSTGAVDDPPRWASLVVPSFEAADAQRSTGPVGSRDFVVIMTRDHAVDERILTQFLPASPRLAYLGVIGSRGKVGRFHKRLAARAPAGFEHWHRVRGPIGLEIGAETPEEIAVSLLAELIAVKNGVTAT